MLFGSFGIWAAVTAHDLRRTAARANAALTDRPATAAVEHAVTSAVNKIFSYDYTDVASDARPPPRPCSPVPRSGSTTS